MLCIALVVFLVFDRVGMCAQEGGFDIEGRSLFQFFDHAQHLQFAFYREAVATLDLYGGGAEVADLFEAFPGFVEQVIFGGVVELAGRVEDAASFGRDLRITHAFDLVYKLFFAAGSKHEVCMAIAPGGQ